MRAFSTIAAACLVTACSPSTDSPGAEAGDKITVTVHVIFDADRALAPDTPVPANASVLDAMNAAAADDPRFTLTTQGQGDMVYISAIDGVREDRGAGRYWLFCVNGAVANLGAASYQLDDADEIAWKRTTYPWDCTLD